MYLYVDKHITLTIVPSLSIGHSLTHRFLTPSPCTHSHIVYSLTHHALIIVSSLTHRLQFTLLGLWLVIIGMGTYVYWMVLESRARPADARPMPPAMAATSNQGEHVETTLLDNTSSAVQ